MRKDVLPRFLNSHYAEELFTNLSLCDPLPVASQLIVDPPHDDSLLPGKSNNINTPYQYALSTHPISTPYPPTLYFPFFFYYIHLILSLHFSLSLRQFHSHFICFSLFVTVLCSLSFFSFFCSLFLCFSLFFCSLFSVFSLFLSVVW